MTVHPPTMTLADAKAWLRERVRDGEMCPCCNRLAKVYRIRLNATMAATLLVMHQTHGARGELRDLGNAKWIHVLDEIQPIVLARCGKQDLAYSKLRFWGLIEPHPRQKDDARPERASTGLWRMTERGRLWALGRLAVPTYVLIYDNVKLGEEGVPCTIHGALGKRFHYVELMEGV